MSLTHFLVMLVALANPGPTQGAQDPPNDRVLQGRPFALWVKDLKSKEPSQRIPAIVVMGLLGPKAKETIPVLCLALRDREVEVRVAAATALGRIGPDDQSFAALLTAEADVDPDVRRIARAELGRWYPTLKERVTALLKTAESGQGQAAAQGALMRLGPADREAVPVLVDCITGRANRRAAHLATSALVQLGPTAKEAVPALLTLAHVNADPQLRARAVTALGMIHLEAHLVVPALAKLLAAPEIRHQEKSVVAEMLSRFGSEARGAVPVLHTVMTDQEPLLRLAAAEAVLKIDPKDAQAIPVIVAVMRKNGDASLRMHAAQRLGQIGPAAKAAIRDLGEALADAEPNVAIQAALTLGRFGKEAKPAQAALLTAARHHHEYLRMSALHILVLLQPTETEAVDHLLALMTHPNQQVRLLANHALRTSRRGHSP